MYDKPVPFKVKYNFIKIPGVPLVKKWAVSAQHS